MVSLSVLIITQGREDLLLKCLESLRGIEAPWQLILGANGAELSPATLDFSKSLTADFSLLEFPETLPPGEARNRCAELAEGEWIHFLDDDSHWTKNYWEIAKTCLKVPQIEIFGGPDVPALGMSAFSESIAIALSSPLCTGMTFSRHRPLGRALIPADEEKLTSCNLWVKRDLVLKHPFPMDYRRGEETYFLQSLKASGHRAFYHPLLQVGHFRRKNLKALFRPTFFAGYFRSKVMREKLTVGAEVFWLPTVFVFLHFIVIPAPDLFLQLAELYLGIILSVSLGLSVKAGRIQLFPLVGFLHYFIVFNYGLGFLAERLGMFNHDQR